MKAINSADTAPIRSEPIKIRKNDPIEFKISSVAVLPSEPVFMTVVYMTIPIASLNMDSPNTIA